MCIYIYIWMCMCGSLWMFVDEWPRRGSYLRHLWSGTGVSRRPFFVYFSAKTTQRVVSAKTRETRREGWRELVSLWWDPEAVSLKQRSNQSTVEKQSVRGRGSVSWEWDSGVWSQDTEQWRRWLDESAFLVAE